MEFKSFKNKRDSRKEYRINRIIMEFKSFNNSFLISSAFGINRIIMEFKLSTPLSKHYTVPPELIES